jgi:hypothetical protein
MHEPFVLTSSALPHLMTHRAERRHQVTIDAVVAMNRIITGCGSLLFSPLHNNREVYQNLVHGWIGLLANEDHDCVAAAQCILSFVGCDEGQVKIPPCPTSTSTFCRDGTNESDCHLQAVLIMWPNMEELIPLVGLLVSQLAHGNGQETVLQATTAAALAALFRGTPGETLLRRLLEPADLFPEPTEPTSFWGSWFATSAAKEEPPPSAR